MTVLKLSESDQCFACQLILATTESEIIEHEDYLHQLSRGSLATFSILDFISRSLRTSTKNVYVPSVSERVLLQNSGYITNFTCDLHKEWGEKLTAKNAVNIFLITNKTYKSVKK